MKFVISLLFTLPAWSFPIHVYHEDVFNKADAVKEIFKTSHHIPDELISIKLITNCDELKNGGKLDVCLKNNGDLLVVSVDKSFVYESLKIFQAP